MIRRAPRPRDARRSRSTVRAVLAAIASTRHVLARTPGALFDAAAQHVAGADRHTAIPAGGGPLVGPTLAHRAVPTVPSARCRAANVARPLEQVDIVNTFSPVRHKRVT